MALTFPVWLCASFNKPHRIFYKVLGWFNNFLNLIHVKILEEYFCERKSMREKGNLENIKSLLEHSTLLIKKKHIKPKYIIYV